MNTYDYRLIAALEALRIQQLHLTGRVMQLEQDVCGTVTYGVGVHADAPAQLLNDNIKRAGEDATAVERHTLVRIDALKSWVAATDRSTAETGYAGAPARLATPRVRFWAALARWLAQLSAATAAKAQAGRGASR